MEPTGRRSVPSTSAYAVRQITECLGNECEAKPLSGKEFCAKCERICPCCGDRERSDGAEFCAVCCELAECEECGATTGSPKALLCHPCLVRLSEDF